MRASAASRYFAGARRAAPDGGSNRLGRTVKQLESHGLNTGAGSVVVVERCG